jgi:hypothetical protein
MTRRRKAPQALVAIGTVMKVLIFVVYVAITCVRISNLYHSRHPLYALIPLAIWAFIGAIFIFFLVLLRRGKQRAAKARAGFCIKCGYDLRASPGRCPECGTIRLYPMRKHV